MRGIVKDIFTDQAQIPDFVATTNTNRRVGSSSIGGPTVYGQGVAVIELGLVIGIKAGVSDELAIENRAGIFCADVEVPFRYTRH